MGLIGDIQESKNLWLKSSWLFRIVILVSTFFAISSIASLSDVIFHWKGFIYDGIKFYSTWISEPIKKIALEYGLEFSTRAVDFMILQLLFVMSVNREFWSEHDKLESFVFSVIIIIAVCVLVIFVSKIESFNPWGILTTIITILVFPLIYQYSLHGKIIYYTPIAMGVIIVLLLGAVNSGISRPVG